MNSGICRDFLLLARPMPAYRHRPPFRLARTHHGHERDLLRLGFANLVVERTGAVVQPGSDACSSNCATMRLPAST